MDMDSPPVSASPIPSITGNPGLDSLIRSALIAAAAALTGVMLTWLNAHGFNDPNLNLLLSGAVLTVLTTAVVALWGYLKGTQFGRVVADAHLDGARSMLAGVQAGAKVWTAGDPDRTPVLLADLAPADITHADVKALTAQYTPPKA